METSSGRDFETLIGRFHSELDVGSVATRNQYCAGVWVFMEWKRDNGVESPTAQDLIRYKHYLRDSGFKPTTQANYLAAIKAFFRWMHSVGLYDEDIAAKVKGVKGANGRQLKDWLSPTNATALVESINPGTAMGARDLAIIYTSLSTSARRHELHLANIEDIRLVEDKMVLWIQGKGHQDKDEYVVLPPEVQRAINHYLYNFRKPYSGSDPLFISHSTRNRGARLSKDMISNIGRTHLERLGLSSPRVSFHSLRHSAVSFGARVGKLEEVQGMSRHRSLETIQVYLHGVERIQNPIEHRIAEHVFSPNLKLTTEDAP